MERQRAAARPPLSRRLARRPSGRLPRTGTVVATVVALVLGTVAVVATRSPGYTTDHLEANDGTLWVTNDRAGLFGRLNAPAAHLDAAFPSGETAQTYQLDVVQAGGAVLTRDRITGTVAPVDVRSGTLVTDRAVSLPATAPLAVGGTTAVVADPETGEVRASASSTASLAAVDGLSSTTDPVATVPLAPDVTGDALAVDVAAAADGTAWAVGSGGDLVTLSPTGDGRFARDTSSLGGPLQDVRLVVTPDGPVVLDTVGGLLARPDGSRTPVEGEPLDGGVVQEGLARDRVLVATPRSLVEVDLEDGTSRALATGGTGPAAAPVVLDGCAYVVWSGSPGRAATACDGAPAEDVVLDDATTLLSPHLRLNHRSVALNDSASGGVWSLDDGERLDDWEAVAPPSSQETPDDADEPTTVDRSSRPPEAVDDELGARPGRSSVLHVLDNDSNPSGSVLSITRVTDVPEAVGSVAIAPDGQTVQLTLTGTASGAAFEYTIDDGRGNGSTARVVVAARGPQENGAPRLREGYEPEVVTVVNRGSVSLPVVGDWRDPDSDPVAVTAATDGDAPVSITPDGRLRYTAPGEPGPRTVEYVVSDGTAESTGEVRLQVLEAASTATTAATPLPDVGRGEVGTPVVLRPLENDVPGTDPTTPAARLQLAGAVVAPDGTTVETSVEAGTVTVTAGAPGTYLLAYTVRYGDAPFARGAMRVDVRAAADREGRIIAMPDQAVVNGQTATIVDVLANDVDPAGGLLVVQGAETDSSDAVEVAVLRGRWLRIAATRPELRPNPVLVRYTVTNGTGGTASGDVSVLQVPEPADRTPVAVDDVATVRSGDHVSVPVLDNDIDPAGSPLRLSPQVAGAARSGTLPVRGPDGGAVDGDPGAAYVSGSVVRYQAPEVTAQRTVTVEYLVENGTGGRATGTARITVTPPPSAERPNRSPAPAAIEGRVVAGDTITVSVPGSGSDPDGDSTTLVGLASAPTLGRVLSLTPSSVTYQAYPTSGGTDDVTYLLGDRFGKVGTGTVRIAVAPPGDPQPVVAVDDEVTAAPGADVLVDVLANDIQPIGERAVVEPLGDAGTGEGAASLDPDSGTVTVTAPAAEEPRSLRYSIVGASGESSAATLRVRGREGTNLPPVPRNALANPAPRAATVDVDLLAGSVDPDDPGAPLRVTRVFGAPGASVAEGVATLPVTDLPQVLAFEVADAGGAAALGLVHVPAGGSGAPTVRPGSLVQVDRNGTTTLDLEDVALDPAGGPLTLTTTDRLSASPVGSVRVEADGPSRLVVTGLADYVGPAAIAFEVTTGTGPDDAGARRALLTVPVQVGPETPVLRCPQTPVDVVVGGRSRPLSVGALCHVWTADPAAADELRFTGTFEEDVPGLVVERPDDGTLVVRASSAAVPGTSVRLLVTAEGTEAVPSPLTVRVAPAEPPRMAPVTLAGVRAGTTQTVTLDGYLSSQLGDPVFQVLDVQRVSGAATTVRREGPTTLSVTPSREATGRVDLRVTVTDVESATRRDRQTTGTITVQVLGVPDAPGAPVQTGPTLSESARLTWRAPVDNGLPVESYEVAWDGGTQVCDASPCLVTGLRNATPQRFTVRARNAVGYGPPSATSAPVVPDEVPGAPVAPRVLEPRDRTVTVAWDPAPTGGSAVDRYLVTWPGGRAESTSTTVTAGGLDNSVPTPFTVKARNDAGWGPGVTVEGQSAGVPQTPAAPRLEVAELAGGARQAVVASWDGVAPNGPGDTRYALTRSGPGGSVEVCRTTATRCEAPAVDNDGATYTYRLTAANDVVGSPAGPSSSQRAVGTPGEFTGVSAAATGEDRRVRLRFTSPPARDESVTVTCRVSGDPCGEWTLGAEPRAVDEVVAVPANGSTATVTLTATNTGALSSSAQVTSDVVYGPLGAVDVTVLATVGPYVTFSVAVDPAGREADVAVSVDGGVPGTADPPGRTTSRGPWAGQYTVKVGYDRSVQVAASVSRGGQTRDGSAGATTGTATVTVSETDAGSGDGRVTVSLDGASPSTVMTCTIRRGGLGLGDRWEGTVETDAAGDGSRAVPAEELTVGSGRTYDVSCDDTRSPATPVETEWTAP
ncbi:hypothetical protein KC207_08130 [Phycicoccus sp. BSK3Z-2]|uniref:Fibronectin type-III domain-containing protein n=1 Tax=Phycicoccus avicenniae TaxID=2828860 RepID=A0A941HZV2_9MICO|nr:fibronectin type III domain-containing protein [Phycicoccus avicenniae]MBR7743255.1 hypothetical protein [Phycicoccus avicenniae]